MRISDWSSDVCSSDLHVVPLYLAYYVRVTYGTGAIMAVPGEDQRDWDFAEAYDLPVIRTVQPPEGFEGKAYTGTGVASNSTGTTISGDELDLNGLEMAEAKARAIDWLTANGIGQHRVNYRLRDWLLSRQRFWGCPIPIVYCTSCEGLDGNGAVPVPDDQLPVIAPDDVEFLPTGESPLRHHEGFLRRSEEHTSELQSLMRISYAVFCLKKNINLRNKQLSPPVTLT